MIRRLLLLEQPQETRFFVFIGLFGIVLGALYWVLSDELAGTTLLAGFGLASLLVGLRLLVARPERVVAGLAARASAGHRVAGDGDQRPAGGRAGDPGEPPADLPGGGTGGVDTPFGDESGRLPDETLAPLATGLGVALGITAVVFGPWLLIAGLVPLAWGAWTWLTGAGDELEATVEAEQEAPGARPEGAPPAGV